MFFQLNDCFSLDLRAVQAIKVQCSAGDDKPRYAGGGDFTSVSVLMDCGEWLTFHGEDATRLAGELSDYHRKLAARFDQWEEPSEDAEPWWRRVLAFFGVVEVER